MDHRKNGGPQGTALQLLQKQNRFLVLSGDSNSFSCINPADSFGRIQASHEVALLKIAQHMTDVLVGGLGTVTGNRVQNLLSQEGSDQRTKNCRPQAASIDPFVVTSIHASTVFVAP